MVVLSRSHLGLLAETLVAVVLVARGWTLLGWRRRIAGVEIDWLARRGHELILVEVKGRRGRFDDDEIGRFPVSAGQRRRLHRALAQLESELGTGRHALRLDLAEVRFSPWPRLRWTRGIEAPKTEGGQVPSS